MMFEASAFLEQRLREMLDDTLGRVPQAGMSAAEIARQLSGEIASATRRFESGAAYAPDQYTFSMHPLDAKLVLEHAPQIQAELGRRLREALAVEGYAFVREPQVTLATDPTVERGEVRTLVWRSSNPLRVATPNRPQTAEAAEKVPAGAFLVIDGRRNFPLVKPLIRIGRRMENDLILADLHVSRFHAELRLLEGRFVVVDLDSTSGTFVNGKRVHEHPLVPGDLVTIARSMLIYGEDPGGPPAMTPPYTPPGLPREKRDLVTPMEMKTLTGERPPKG